MPRHATLLEEITPAVESQDVSEESGLSIVGRIGKPIYDSGQINDSQHVSNYNNTSVSRQIAPDDVLSAMPLIGQSPQMKHLFSLIERIAPTDSSTLITGATGTGKELVALAIHQLSPRSHAPFVDINCSAIPDTLFEAELFGHQRGSFTGAHETRRGLFEEAAGGTLFLDEVDALSLSSQAKLLRVLQERCLRRVGGRENIPFDVRVISASGRNLQHCIDENTFRIDLYFRLNVLPLYVPGLQERGKEDIHLLIKHFLLKHASHTSLRARRFSEECCDVLAAYNWPGNVRELENAVQYALIVGTEDELTLKDLPPRMLDSVGAERSPGDQVLDRCKQEKLPLAEAERLYILYILDSFDGNQVKAAATLGIDARTLRRKLKLYKNPSKFMIALA
ncbi:MAG: sigma-54 dependent transcriptional regulator [Pyrinomonadaceae bacterium]